MRYLVALFMMFTLAGSAFADPWIPPNLPWGTDCTNWIYTYYEYTSPELIWNPVLPNPFYSVCGTAAWVPPNIQLDLFVELETEVHLDWTLAQVHRASNYEDFMFVLPGWIKSNNPSMVGVHYYDGMPLNFLQHISTVVCNPNSDIPITWWYLDNGVWVQMILGPCGQCWYFTTDLCDQNFTIGIMVDMMYHQPDGYYSTTVTFCTQPICL